MDRGMVEQFRIWSLTSDGEVVTGRPNYLLMNPGSVYVFMMVEDMYWGNQGANSEIVFKIYRKTCLKIVLRQKLGWS